MSDSISQLVQLLDTAETSEELNQVINRIAQIGESAVSELIQYEKTLFPRPAARTKVMKIYQLMGYPANRSAIPSIVIEASRINSPGWEIALDLLLEIGEATIPEVRHALYFYSNDLEGYGLEIQGLCILLERMGSPLIDSLLPELLNLLEEGTDENHVDEYALWPIQKIGSPKADPAAQILSKIILSKRRGHIRKIAIDALLGFDSSATRPLIPILRQCLSDPLESICSSAQIILKLLGEVT